MLWVPQKGLVREQHNTGGVGTASIGTSVTTASTSTTKGSAAQVFASTSFDAYMLTIIASDYGSAGLASEGCMDILIGTAPEAILIPDLLIGYCGSGSASIIQGPKRWDFPLYVPVGSRIAARAAGVRASSLVRVWMFLYGGDGSPPFRVGSKVTTYGVTVPNGTTISPGASGVEGAWTQITAATSEHHFALVPSFQLAGDTITSNRAIAVDVGIGSATEELVGEAYWFFTDANERMGGPWNSRPIFCDVPAGTRLVMRASNSSLNDGAYNGAIHAVS